MSKSLPSLLAALGIATIALSPDLSHSAELTTLVSFNGINGVSPSGLVGDASGNLFGAASGLIPVRNLGTVFKIAKTASGFAAAPTLLAAFNGTNGANPSGPLIFDAQGNLFGTTFGDGGSISATAFELVKTPDGYAPAVKTLSKFVLVRPAGALIADANGNLFGVTSAGPVNREPPFGSVFEIAKTANGYASEPIFLADFNGPNGAYPSNSLIADANGNLIGATRMGGLFAEPDGLGTVFELVKTVGGFASDPTTLVNFSGVNGAGPNGPLVADVEGNLFGTAVGGGAHNAGVVFEIAKTVNGYARSPKTLVSFNRGDGALPVAGLIVDASGNLFGTTLQGGAYGAPDGFGTVFKIAKTANGYANIPTILVNFNSANGSNPSTTLIADADGNLFGSTAHGGTYGLGTVFEIKGSGFVTPKPLNPFAAKLDILLGQRPAADAFQIAAQFGLGANSNGINPVIEPVILTVGAVTITIPTGSFQQKSGLFYFVGAIKGVQMQVLIKAVAAERYDFAAEVRQPNLSGANPVQVAIQIGDDKGAATVTATVHQPPGNVATK